MFTMAPLLIHSVHISDGVKTALRAALETESQSEANDHLQSAAKILFEETDLDCNDVKELVGLREDDCGCGE